MLLRLNTSVAMDHTTIKNSAQNQLLATIIVNLGSVLSGFATAWTSTSFSILESQTGSPMTKGALDQEERSWVASLFSISAAVGTLFYYSLSDNWGRQISLCSIAVPHGISWVLVQFGVHPWQLYASRLLSGLASGGGFVLVPLYVSEICESHVRGRLGSLMMFAANGGFLLSFIAGYYLEYHQIPGIGMAISILYLATFVNFPETPVFLLRTNKEELAEESFRFYRNIAPGSDFCEKCQQDWELMKISLKTDDGSSDSPNRVNWSDLYKTRSSRKAFLIGMTLASVYELCGAFMMLSYTVMIFRVSGSKIAPDFSAIIVGVIQLLGTYVATFSVDRFGRKALLVTSSVGSAICLCCLGTYTYLNSIGVDLTQYSWLSIASFSGMMFLSAIGLAPLMPVVVSEVMPEKVRDIGCTICFCVPWILGFLMAKFFESVAEIFGMHGWMFFFAGCTILGSLFIIFAIPETKGKTYAEIAAILDR